LRVPAAAVVVFDGSANAMRFEPDAGLERLN
jgi:hypothetical protein